jgi:CRP-like cAMP-binding protein
MATSLRPPSDYANLVLSNLSAHSIDDVARHLQPAKFDIRQDIYRPNEPMRYVYFIESGMISIVSIMDDGRSIEVGTIGKESMVGATLLLGVDSTPYHYFVQIAGHGYRLEAAVFLTAVERNLELRQSVLRCEAAYVSQAMQTAACNGLHSITQRCCRWLLMSQDRVQADSFALTHEFLALMLGVRRASVTEVLKPLQERGWIETSRGEIRVVDRKGLELGSCECYRMIAEQQKRSLRKFSA